MRINQATNDYPASIEVSGQAEAEQGFLSLLRPPATELFLDLNLPVLGMMEKMSSLATKILRNHH